MGLFYGVTTSKELDDHIRRACEIIRPSNSALGIHFLREIASAETAYATIRDVHFTQGKGVFQFDSVGYFDVQTRISDNHHGMRDLINNEMGLDIIRMQFNCLDSSPLLGAVFCRLKILLIPNAIPESRIDRARMWKKYYNSSAGKGTVEHYMKQSKICIGE